jgi:hypothetical protein
LRNRNRIVGISAFSLCLLAVGCAVTHTPQGWLSSPRAAQTDAYGGWVNVKYRPAPEISAKYARMEGELIAIGTDSMYVANDRFHGIAVSSIKSARLVTYKSNAGEMGVLVFLGTLSTISNGWFLGFTAPMWMIGGGITSSKLSYDAIVDYPNKELSRFAPYARYPQGLPSVIDRSRIKMKRGMQNQGRLDSPKDL